MATDIVTAEVTMSSALQVARKNMLHKTFIESNREINTMKFDDFELETLKYYYHNVAQLPDDNPHVLAVVDITDALDNAFVIAADQCACPFCKGPLAHYMFRECPSRVAFVYRSR